MNLYKRGNHRPISLLSIFNRIFEKLVYKRLVKFVNKHNILYSSQYGYGSRHSTQHATQGILNDILSNFNKGHPRRPRGSQSGREKVRAKEPLGTDSHRTISKNSSGCRHLTGHKKCFVLLCPIGKVASKFFSLVPTRRLLFPSRLIWLMHQRNARSQETLSLI